MTLLSGVNARWKRQDLKRSRYILLDVSPCLPGPSAFTPSGHVTEDASKTPARGECGEEGAPERRGLWFLIFF